MKKAMVVIGVLLVCGGVAAFFVLGQEDDPRDKSGKNASAKKKSEDQGKKTKVKSGTDEYEQIEAAVSAEYTESYVANVEVSGNGDSATATLDDGTQVPLQLENGEWVPQVDAPEASTPEVSTPQADVPQASTPEVSTPQVETPSTPATPSTPSAPSGP